MKSRLDNQLVGESACHGVSLTGDVRSTGHPGLDATVFKRTGENTLGTLKSGTTNGGAVEEGGGGGVGDGGGEGEGGGGEGGGTESVRPTKISSHRKR